MTAESATDGEAPRIDDQPFIDATSQAKSRYGRFNLAIIGGTGVGKSSLVNAVFGRDLAKVGKGLPVTQGAHYYHDDSLGIWDLEGFEIGTEKRPIELLHESLEVISHRPPNEQISVVWYCVNSHSDRLQRPEIDMIRDLNAKGLPVILVLTKVDWEKNPITNKRTVPLDTKTFVDWLNEPVDSHDQPIVVPYREFVLTSTRDRNGKGKGHGLGELVAETLALSPEDEKDAFRIAQRLNLPWKRELARPVIVTAAAAAATAAAVPLPVANAVALAPVQLAMMGRIATIYDLELKTMLSATALAQLATQLAGQSLARGALALIPGAGSAINAGVAGALTAAMGEGWLRLCEQVHTSKLDPAKVADELGAYVPGFLDIIRKMAEQKIAKS
ncbi:MAG: GTPase family protein [Microbacterium sp.]|uniref:GTPase family protein n=1 Tax=Microbacterium sp. TaxID=51671 RepID=UPI003F7F4B68